MKSLAERLEQFHVMIDSDYGIDVLDKYPLKDKKWSVFIKLDCGCKRGNQVNSFFI